MSLGARRSSRSSTSRSTRPTLRPTSAGFRPATSRATRSSALDLPLLRLAAPPPSSLEYPVPSTGTSANPSPVPTLAPALASSTVSEPPLATLATRSSRLEPRLEPARVPPSLAAFEPSRFTPQARVFGRSRRCGSAINARRHPLPIYQRALTPLPEPTAPMLLRSDWRLPSRLGRRCRLTMDVVERSECGLGTL
jgi:hypothetical protein